MCAPDDKTYCLENNRMNTFEEHRPYLFGIAYRMLGSVMEAEDIVQDAYLRWREVKPDSIQSHRAFLSTVVTRLCLDQLKSAREKRETYIGPWLPEPLVTDITGPAQHLGDLESLSMAFMVLLESLSPVERAVFLLREVFDYDYAEIARMVDKEEAACRQILSRAKKHITANRPRFESTPEAHQAMLGRFLTACQQGDLDGLMSLLAEDVTSLADGGGKVAAARRPVHGRELVARLMLGLVALMTPDMYFEIAPVNARMAVIVRENGIPINVLNIETDGNVIYTLRSVANPDKLRHLYPADGSGSVQSQ